MSKNISNDPPGKDLKAVLKKTEPEKLIKKYFQQLTSGCGRPDCPNKECVSGGRTALSTNEAGALALHFLMKNAQICDMIDLDPVTVLSYSYLQQLVTSCKHEYTDFRRITAIIGKVFSSSELLNKSFLCDEGDLSNGPQSILPINHQEVIKAYKLLLNLGEESIENAIINGINALGNRIDIELKTHKKLYTKDDLNQFVIVLLNPNLLSPEYLECALPNILIALTSLPTELQLVLVRYWSKYTPEELHDILDVFQQMITMRILTGPHASTGRPVNDDPPITNSVKCMKMIYYASLLGGEYEKDIKLSLEEHDDSPMTSGDDQRPNLLSQAVNMQDQKEIKMDDLQKMIGVDFAKCRKPLIPFNHFLNEPLNDVIEMDHDFTNFKGGLGGHSFLNYPFVLNTFTKNYGLFYDNRVRMYSERRMSIVYGLMNGSVPSPYLKLRVRRDHLIQDALVTLEMTAQESPEDFKKQFVVEFDGEQGIDEGGVSKEFFQLVIEELFNPDFGMFEFNEENHTCWFNPSSFETDNQFTLIGLLFGIAMYNSCILDVHFPPVLYRKLFGLKGRVEDLQVSHPIFFRGLESLLNHTGKLEEDAMITFEVSYDAFGSPVNCELVKDGKNIFVTKDNREEYVARYADFLLNISIKKQFDAFKRGFDIVTQDSILKSLFRPDELELLVCGSQKFDIKELQRTTEYDGGYSKDSPVIQYFWEVVDGMDHEQHKQLLSFTTGSDRVPIGGLAKLKLTIVKNGEDSDRLPTAHTCFNALLLPEYSSRERLEDRLLKAISNAKGFGLM